MNGLGRPPGAYILSAFFTDCKMWIFSRAGSSIPRLNIIGVPSRGLYFTYNMGYGTWTVKGRGVYRLLAGRLRMAFLEYLDDQGLELIDIVTVLFDKGGCAQ